MFDGERIDSGVGQKGSKEKKERNRSYNHAEH